MEAYQRSQDVPLPLTAVAQAALREYLERRGFLSPPAGREFAITPAEKGSGSNDVSAEHNRYFAEAAADKSRKGDEKDSAGRYGAALRCGGSFGQPP